MFYKLESFVVFFKLLNCLLLSRLIFFPFQFNQCSRDATDASPVDSIVYYSSKRFMYSQHFGKVA